MGQCTPQAGDNPELLYGCFVFPRLSQLMPRFQSPVLRQTVGSVANSTVQESHNAAPDADNVDVIR